MEAFPLIILAYALQLMVAGILVQAGFSKLRSENQVYYINTIEAYAIAPRVLIPLLPKAIGLLEVLACLLIIVPATSRFGMALAAFLFALYLVAFLKQIIQGKADMNCGCAGPGAEMKISSMLLARNAVLITLSLYCANAVAVPLGVSWLLLVPLVGILTLIYFSSDQLIANQQKIKLLRNT